MGLKIQPLTPELEQTIRQLIRTPQDAADYLIAEFEAQTGETATEEDRAEALRSVLAARTAGNAQPEEAS